MNELFLTVLNMSLTASYVILFVILIRLLLKKVPKVISYALWGVVAFRLIIPFSFESILSLMPRNTNAVPIPQDIIYQQNPQINSGIEVVDSFISRSLPAPTIGASVNPLQIYVEIGAYIWILGIIALLAYSIVSILILKRQLKSAQLIEKNIFEARNLKTPFVLGLIRPKIYLPVGLNVEERGYILLHEQTHIHRKDHIIKVLAFLTLSIHWFNPLVWISFMLMSTDMELSCDERVLTEMDEETKKPYANSLLSLATGKHILNGSPLAFGEGNVKGRIKNVLNYKRPRFWIIAISIIIVTTVGIGLILNPKVNGLGESQQITDFSTVTTQKDISNHVSSPEVKLPANNSNEKAGASIVEETIALEALKEFYGQTNESIVIYEQIPFDNDYMLVLADRITDGEHYPNLYLINSDGIVSSLTRHSNCWALNFTELSGYKVFFGLAGREVNQASNNTISVNKVEAIFDGKVEAVKTRKNAYAYINLYEKDIETINNSNGYILVAKKTDMPEDIIGVSDGGQKVSLSQASIDRNRSYMPKYLESTDKSIYNSSAFTYSPMISPAYWMQIGSEEVGIKGSTDANGNLNAVSLRPSQAVFKTVHSSEIPNDIKAFYLSNCYPWTATFAVGENVEVVYSTETELYDCHVYKLTPQSVDKKIGIKELKRLSVTGENRIILPKESGDYLFLLRTEKNFELRSFIGVISIY
ncbi:MAG TPA: M56 family metallopeptidase [Pseudobacteroides sp.]|uniref:M56 family metallopeptidase n=1 Tax=Pseudobacteroides sp. TaxID=1968840 RepID=UPI002F92AEA0